MYLRGVINVVEWLIHVVVVGWLVVFFSIFCGFG